MKKLFIGIMGVFLVAVIAIFACAETKEVKQSTVSDVIENAVAFDRHEVYVVLNGTIASQISKKRFWFQDETGQVILDVKSDILESFSPTMGAKVEIRGVVDSEADNDSHLEIDVDEIVAGEDEEQVEIM